jgi:hypothetical protein
MPLRRGAVDIASASGTEDPGSNPSTNYLYQHLPLQDPPKLTQIAIFGLKIHKCLKMQCYKI